MPDDLTKVVFDISDKVTAQYYRVSNPDREYVTVMDHNGNGLVLEKTEALNLIPVILEMWPNENVDLGNQM